MKLGSLSTFRTPSESKSRSDWRGPRMRRFSISSIFCGSKGDSHVGFEMSIVESLVLFDQNIYSLRIEEIEDRSLSP